MRAVVVFVALISVVAAQQMAFARGMPSVPQVSSDYPYAEEAADSEEVPPVAFPQLSESSEKPKPIYKAPIIAVKRNGGKAATLPPLPVLKPIGQAPKKKEKTGEDSDDPEILKLNAALEAVKQDIMGTSKQIAEERKWVAAVKKITSSYEEKSKRVEEHILALRKEMKKLYQKKKQLENLKLQRALEAKLKEANAELAKLLNSLNHVREKGKELDKSHSDLRATIAGIQSQLAKLKGQGKTLKKKSGKSKKAAKRKF